MLILPGSPALSAFRKEKLLEALPQAEALSARFVHFVELSEALDERERQILDGLLEYGPSVDDASPHKESAEGELFVVVPRPGEPVADAVVLRLVGGLHALHRGGTGGAARMLVPGIGLAAKTGPAVPGNSRTEMIPLR